MAKRQIRVPSVAPWGDDLRGVYESIRKNVLPTINALLRGKANNTFDLTLEPGETSTVFASDIVTPDSVVQLVPQSESAASVQWWVEIAAGRAVIHHDASEATDRTFGVVVNG